MKQSIGRILNFKIAVVVICVNVFLCLGSYSLSVRQTNIDFHKSLEGQAKHLADTFARQLWLFDWSSAEHLAMLALESHEIEGLRLMDHEKNVLVEKGSFSEDPLEYVRKELRFEKVNLVGFLELSFSDAFWKSQRRQTFYASLSMVGVTILLTFVMISILLNRYLTQPLRELQQDMGSVAGGQLQLSKISSETSEIHSIIDSFNKMTTSLTQREEQKVLFERERTRLENQLHQAQKIESVGRLAGGVAHDFNNMLGVIIGYAELGRMKIDKRNPLHDNFEQILAAATRSRDITKQLLAFARKQTIAPKVLDLNATVEAMLKMLRKLLGENIDLVWVPKPGLWAVEMDPSQLDQILTNLCVNARDAIADVGKMTIETNMASLDEAYCDDHEGFIPGDFVVLTVSDDGCGMEKQALDKIFEPFFTTKRAGEGTGLGLAMVYGVVKQSNGFINVYSEPGQGTTFKIYLPRHAGQAVDELEPVGSELLMGRGETVLVVEDEEPLLKLATALLTDFGYRVLAANTPLEALELAKAHLNEIQLLVTDVVMPEMNGRELADQLRRMSPDIKCLYMSGYTENVIAHHGVLDKGIHFIQKPFSRMDFSIRIRKALALDM